MKKIAIILGTRPEIIKLSPIIRRLKKKGNSFFIIHTNQHYTASMDEVFFKELQLPAPRYNLNVGSGLHGEQTAKMITGIEKILIDESPDVIVVQGDTNTVLAGALAASKLNIKIAHVEAGLRSYDRGMPEEINRVIADHASEFLFCPTDNQKNILIQENIPKSKISVVGNTISDAVQDSINISNGSIFLKENNLEKNKYFLLTLHRPSNVDDKDNLEEILMTISKIAKTEKINVFFPIHPRTRKTILEFNISIPDNILLKEPIGYMDMLLSIKNTSMVFTDSGGIQEEACILHSPCVTLRFNTERPETVDIGAAILAGNKKTGIINGYSFFQKNKNNYNWRNPFGENVSDKIISILLS